MQEIVDLGISLTDYRDAGSIDMRQARELIRGRKGRASLEVVRRWCNPCRGWSAPDGRRLILPAVRVAGCYRTMPCWVEVFERKRHELGSLPVRQGRKEITDGQRSASHRRACRHLDAAGIGGGEKRG